MPALDARAHGPAWRRDDRHGGAAAVLVWVLVLLMIVPEGLDYTGLLTPGAPDAAGAASRALWIAVLAGGAGLLLWRHGLALSLLSVLNPFLLLFVALAVASLAWSIDPALTARRLVRLFAIVGASIAFVLVAWHPQRLQRVLRPVLTAVLAGSVVFVFAAPSLAVHHESAAELAGAWRGLANHKNGLGALACTALLLWMHGGLARQCRWPAVWAASSLALLCLVMSRSSTAAVAAAVGVGFMAFALRAPPSLRRRLPLVVVTLTFALLVYALGLLGLLPGAEALIATIAALSDKGGTLTGRTGIWAILAEHVALRPWLGSGYAAYWTALPLADSESAVFLRRMGGFYPGSAHNGYLEVLVDLGAAGLGLLLLYAAMQVRQSLRLLRQDAAQAVLLLALFFQQAVTNLAESHWFSVLSIDFVVMTLATTALARALLDQHWRARFGAPEAAA